MRMPKRSTFAEDPLAKREKLIEIALPTFLMAPDAVVRTITENSRTLKFTAGSGFEEE